VAEGEEWLDVLGIEPAVSHFQLLGVHLLDGGVTRVLRRRLNPRIALLDGETEWQAGSSIDNSE